MIDELLKKFRGTLGDEFIAHTEALRFLDLCREQHPAELDEWLRFRAAYFISTELRTMLKRERVRARARAGPRAFAEASAALSTGTEEGRAAFETYYVTNHKNLWKKLGSCTADNLGFVADEYEKSAKRDMKKASLFRYLQRKVPPHQKLADVIDEAEFADLYRRYVWDDDA